MGKNHQQPQHKESGGTRRTWWNVPRKVEQCTFPHTAPQVETRQRVPPVTSWDQKPTSLPRSQRCHSRPPCHAPQRPPPPLSLTAPNRAPREQGAQLQHEERGAREGLHPSLLTPSKGYGDPRHLPQARRSSPRYPRCPPPGGGFIPYQGKIDRSRRQRAATALRGNIGVLGTRPLWRRWSRTLLGGTSI